jgi:hypothetical protein
MIGKRLSVGLRIIAVLSATCLLGAPWTAARTSALARHGGACRHRAAAEVVARTHEIVVYREGNKKTGERLYACLRRGGAVVELFESGSGLLTDIVTQVSARSGYAGFVDSWHGIDTAGTYVYVVNVATGDWVVDEAADGCAAVFDLCGATRLVLGPAGSAAWLVAGDKSVPHQPT